VHTFLVWAQNLREWVKLWGIRAIPCRNSSPVTPIIFIRCKWNEWGEAGLCVNSLSEIWERESEAGTVYLFCAKWALEAFQRFQYRYVSKNRYSWQHLPANIFRYLFKRLQLKNVHIIYKIQPAKVASRSYCVTRHCWNPTAFGGLAGVNVKPCLHQIWRQHHTYPSQKMQFHNTLQETLERIISIICWQKNIALILFFLFYSKYSQTCYLYHKMADIPIVKCV